MSGDDDKVFSFEKFRPKSPLWAEIDAKRKAPSAKRKSRKRPFVEAPFFAISLKDADRLWACGAIDPPTYLMVVIDRLEFGPGGESPVSLTPDKLASFGINPRVANRALHKLERGKAAIVSRRRGRCPVVKSLLRSVPAAAKVVEK